MTTRLVPKLMTLTFV